MPLCETKTRVTELTGMFLNEHVYRLRCSQSVDSEGRDPNTNCLIMVPSLNPHASMSREECLRLHAPLPKTLGAHIKTNGPGSHIKIKWVKSMSHCGGLCRGAWSRGGGMTQPQDLRGGITRAVEEGKSLRSGNNKIFQVETNREHVVNESTKKEESESGDRISIHPQLVTVFENIKGVVASSKEVTSSPYRQTSSLSEELQSTDWLDYPETLPLQHQHLHNHKYSGRHTFHGPQLDIAHEEFLSRPSSFWPGLPMEVPSFGNRPSRQNRPDGNLGPQTPTSGSFRPGGPPGGFRPPFNRDDDDDQELFVFDRPTSPGANSGLVDGRPDGRPTRPTRPTARPSTRVTATTRPSTVTSTTQNICTTNCPVTNEFNPVCGTDQVTYGNPGKLNCAVNCGKIHSFRHGNTQHDPLLMAT
uniref:Kazal-like domain-containing protein n=1 Tax=Timema tahoe TaxID=61484 RepID=A0A7R9INV3_9NEOP|nr:unnamed protein product [Timema tahoe]